MIDNAKHNTSSIVTTVVLLVCLPPLASAIIRNISQNADITREAITKPLMA
jgi:hypothetical protein